MREPGHRLNIRSADHAPTLAVCLGVRSVHDVHSECVVLGVHHTRLLGLDETGLKAFGLAIVLGKDPY